jgi:hypothetical protein
MLCKFCCGCLGVLQVWQDGHKRSRGDPNYLTLWKPIAPAGYVAMGVLASLGGREPPSYNLVRLQLAGTVATASDVWNPRLACNAAVLHCGDGALLLVLMHALCLCRPIKRFEQVDELWCAVVVTVSVYLSHGT